MTESGPSYSSNLASLNVRFWPGAVKEGVEIYTQRIAAYWPQPFISQSEQPLTFEAHVVNATPQADLMSRGWSVQGRVRLRSGN